MQQTLDGGYIITGTKITFGIGDIWLIKTNSFGDTLWTKTFGGSNDESGYSVQQTKDEGYIMTGNTSSYGHGAFDIWIIKTTPELNKVEQKNNKMTLDYNLSQNYPNPFNPNTAIEFALPKTELVSLKVFNILGQQVTTLVSEKSYPGVHKYEWQTDNLPSGIYYCRLQVGEFEQVRKMILLR